MKQLFLATHLRKQMMQHILSCLPEEGCGIIGGRENRAEIVLPVTNQLHSTTKFLMDPQEQLDGFLKLETLNLELLAFYHSHPSGPEVPSQSDIAEFYYPGVISIIWSPVETGWQVRGFEIVGNGCQEVELVWQDDL